MGKPREGERFGLGIESTAHTFAASVVDSRGDVLSDVREVYRAPAGAGIHPREAARHHAEVSASVVKASLVKAGKDISEMDFIAYSAGPGLGPCLRVGAVVARSLSSYFGIPLVPVNHAVGHLELGCLLTGTKDPVCLLVSGGHTTVVVASGGRWRIFGETLDITVGQLIDQFGRYIGLPSPCGPSIERMAKQGHKLIDLPFVVKGNDVSFSGLLTACKKLVGKESNEDIAYSLQEHAYAMLCEVTERALAFSERTQLLVVGGVAANRRLTDMLKHVARRQNVTLAGVPIRFAGDCGVQIAWTGMLEFESGNLVGPRDGFIRQAWRLDRVDVPWRS